VNAGAELIAAPTRTPWNSLNSRLAAPAGLQLTLFEEAATPRLYTDLAGWFHLLTAPSEYVGEASRYRQLLDSAGPVRTVVEFGSGGGNNASHLKAHFQMTLVDVAPDMLRLSESINPECEHVVGDMRSVRLDRRFDAVFIHDAINYMTTQEDLRGALETAFVHLRPGGAALCCPDSVRENYAGGHDCGGSDGAGLLGMRYLEWQWDPDPEDETYVVDFAYLLREPDGSVRCETDRHVLGLFSRETWLRLMGEVGFAGAQALPFEHSEVEAGSMEIFVGIKPLSEI
jgi:hypothetical protein